MLQPLQQAAPLWQHDAPIVGLALLIIGHLPPQLPILPFLWAAISHLPSLQQPLSLPQHDFPLAILPSLWAAISHLPSLQQPSPQHDFPLAILPSFIGHLSPEQHAQGLALSPVAGAAGAACVAVCAIMASANSIVNTTTITLVFIISSLISLRGRILSAGLDMRRHISPSRRRSEARSRS